MKAATQTTSVFLLQRLMTSYERHINLKNHYAATRENLPLAQSGDILTSKNLILALSWEYFDTKESSFAPCWEYTDIKESSLANVLEHPHTTESSLGTAHRISSRESVLPGHCLENNLTLKSPPLALSWEYHIRVFPLHCWQYSDIKQSLTGTVLGISWH